jgi:hypothetical protein
VDRFSSTPQLGSSEADCGALPEDVEDSDDDQEDEEEDGATK